MKIKLNKDTFVLLIEAFIFSASTGVNKAQTGSLAFRYWQYNAMNPQPEPPGHWQYDNIRPQPEPPPIGWQYGAINPQPEPPGIQQLWYASALAQFSIDLAIERHQLLHTMTDTGSVELTKKIADSTINNFVDDLCGVRPWRWPIPPKYNPELIRPVDLLAAGVQFQKAANTKSVFQKIFANSADKLFEVGLNNIQKQQ